MASEIFTISDATSEYLIQRGIDKKKHFASYLIGGKWAWKWLFKNTIYSVQSEWKTLKAGTPYNYIDMPSDVVRFFSVAEEDECGKIVPLFYNNQLNIIEKPKNKNCGCESCDCSGLCDDINSTVLTTKVAFTINGVDYIEKTWIKSCKNGDIIRYREVPVKKYNDFVGDAGDYNQDYNNDYLIGHSPFGNYSIVTEKFQDIICKLDVHPCGCPIETPENTCKFTDACGNFLRFDSRRKRDKFLPNINNNHRGEVKISECNTKIYYRPNMRHNHHVNGAKLPEFLLVNYQTSGTNCTDTVIVPEYAMEALFAGIDYYSKRFNNTYSSLEKRESKYVWVDAQNDLINFLNPISLNFISNVQDAPIVW